MSANIEIELIPVDIAVNVILEKISNYFLKDASNGFTPDQLENDIAEVVDELRDDLVCLIEFPYVDKMYRDSYYNYFSSKHFPYQRDCIRVSLFDNSIDINDFLNHEKHDKLNDSFLGFFIIRPTTSAVLGRSLISPKAFDNNNFDICTCSTNVLVFGAKLSVDGFPHSSQDQETIKCAETTIWAIMEYFGNKYADYKPALPGLIHSTLKSISFQRQLPSNGLTMNQISYALREFGFGTRVYSHDPYGENEMFNIIDCYVESGIPVIVGLESADETLGHVVIAIGKQFTDKIDWSTVNPETLQTTAGNIEFYSTSNIPAKYVIQDDNFYPYKLIDLTFPGEHYEDDESQTYKIDSAVVPLYPKIYLECVVAKALVLEILKDPIVGYSFMPGFIFRFFLTSSRSFKNHVASNPEIDQVIKKNILITKMPKFIWCGEFYTKEGLESSNREAIGLVILDATEANNQSIDALIFAGYPDRCISFNQNNFVNLQQYFIKYRYYTNLK